MRAEMGMRLDEIRHYIRRTEQIRQLSAPQIKKGEGATAYYQRLLRNSSHIRELTEDNYIFLQNHLYPLLKHTEWILEEEDVIFLRKCADDMLDAHTMQNMDAVLAARIADRLLQDAMQKGDTSYIIEQMDYQVLVNYILKTVLERMDVDTELSKNCEKKCREALEYLYSLLDKEKYRELPDDISRERVLINSRYILCLYDTKNHKVRHSGMGREIMRITRRALEIAEDDFYRKSVSKYDWNHHVIRTLQYTGSLLAFEGNQCFSKDECVEIAGYMTKLRVMLEKEAPQKRIVSLVDASLLEVRAHYYAGQLTREQYIGKLQKLFEKGKKDVAFRSSFCGGVQIGIEYMLALDETDLKQEEIQCLWEMYQSILAYAAGMTNPKSFIYVLECMSYMLASYREKEVGYPFEELCLNCMATLRPLTYVHMMMVGEISACLAEHLLEWHPVLFIGVAGCDSADEVRERKEEVLDFVRHSGRCHDVGKLLFLDTLSIYERDLFAEEFELIQNHSRVGGYILGCHETTRKYEMVARGHHKWYDDSAGYPQDWTNAGRAKRVVIDLVACADCMDAATDYVGRSYSRGISLEQFIQELREQKGTRYAPYVVDLFEDEKMLSQIRELLSDGRIQMYYDTFTELQGRVGA